MAKPARWVWDAVEERMKPQLTRLHVIPIEDEMIHCAQCTCWCSPTVRDEDPAVMMHTATSTPPGWVIVGELEGAS